MTIEKEDFNYQGATEMVSGETSKARQAFQKILDQEGLDNRAVAVANHNLGQTYLMDGDFENAVLYFDKAIGYFRETVDKHSLAFCLSQYALIRRQQSKREEAEMLLVEAVELAHELSISRRNTVVWFVKPYFLNLIHMFEAYGEAQSLRLRLQNAWMASPN